MHRPAPRGVTLQSTQHHVLRLDPYSRHKKFVNDYILHYGVGRPKGWKPPLGADTKTDADILRENHRFIRTKADDGAGDDRVSAVLSWEKRLAKKYYDKLFKEYAIADLSRYKEGMVGLRWRTEPEVLRGKGQFVCSAKGCTLHNELQTFELDFQYGEAGENKQALVKVRVCPGCAARLNYKRARRKARRSDKQERKRRRKQQEHGGGKAMEDVGEGISRSGDGGKSQSIGAESPGATTTAAVTTTAGDCADSDTVWSAPVPAEKTIDDEFDEYFEDLCV